MKPSLLILINATMLASVLATTSSIPPDTADHASEDSGDALVHQVAREMAVQPVLRAALEQHVDLFGQRFSARADYVQKPSPRGPLMRLDWQTEVGDQTASVQYISDGRFLWIHRELLDAPVLQRVDLQRVRAVVSRTSPSDQPASMASDLAILGLPNLLRKIVQYYRLAGPRPARLGDLPVWVVEGQWNPPELAELAESAPANRRTRSSPQLPTHVRVVISQDDWTLRRIEYLRSVSPRRAQWTHEADSPLQPLAVIDVIKSSSTHDPDDGLFQPPDGTLEIVDHTQQFLRSILSDSAGE
jgi:hypothetical protein